MTVNVRVGSPATFTNTDEEHELQLRVSVIIIFLTGSFYMRFTKTYGKGGHVASQKRD